MTLSRSLNHAVSVFLPIRWCTEEIQRVGTSHLVTLYKNEFSESRNPALRAKGLQKQKCSQYVLHVLSCVALSHNKIRYGITQ